MNNYHLRENYELLLKRLSEEQGRILLNVNDLTDRKLLFKINNLLIKGNCEPMTAKELSRELFKNV